MDWLDGRGQTGVLVDYFEAYNKCAFNDDLL